MTANQFSAALVKCGFAGTGKGQSEFARKLGLSDRNVRRWAAGTLPVPPYIAALLHLMLDTGAKADDLKI